MEALLVEQQRQDWSMFEYAGQLVCRDVEGWQVGTRIAPALYGPCIDCIDGVLRAGFCSTGLCSTTFCLGSSSLEQVVLQPTTTPPTLPSLTLPPGCGVCAAGQAHAAA